MAHAMAHAMAYGMACAMAYEMAHDMAVAMAFAMAYAMSYVMAYAMAYVMACAMAYAMAYAMAFAMAYAMSYAIAYAMAYAMAYAISPPYVPWLCAVIVIWLLARAKANWDHNGCRPGFQWTSRLTYLASTYFYTYLASWAHAHGPGPMRMGLASLGMPDQHVAKGLTSKSQGPNQGKPLGLTSKA